MVLQLHSLFCEVLLIYTVSVTARLDCKNYVCTLALDAGHKDVAP